MHDDDAEDPMPSPALDDVLGALRQPARPDELRGEQEAVTAMADVISSPAKGRAPVPIRTRNLKLAGVGLLAAVAAAALGVTTAVAAAALRDPDDHGGDKGPGRDDERQGDDHDKGDKGDHGEGNDD